MSRRRFEELVGDALDTVPAELAAAMDNVVVLVEDRNADDPGLLGLYVGIALTERTSSYGWVLPDMYGTLATIPYDLRTLWTAVGNMAEGQVHDPDLNVMDISQTKGYEVAFDLWERGEGPGGPPAKLRMPAA